MSEKRTIPSLDGLRAIAIAFVIVAHSKEHLVRLVPSILIQYCGSVGVYLFFVISGYLITFLLLKEIDKERQIDFKRFYLRRTFRIFPPFYAYLAVVAILRCFDAHLFTWRSFVSAGTYLWDYDTRAEGWVLSHTWSLGLEEQFYLLWPALLGFAPKKVCLRFASVVVVLSPLIRVAAYVLLPGMRARIDMMLPTHLDTMMVGCFLALASNMGAYPKLLNDLARPVWSAAAMPIVLLAVPLLEQRYRGAFFLPVGITAISVGCGVVLLYSVRNAGSVVGRVLNLAWMRHIGVISYSLYLWQQLFTGERTRMFPLNLVLVVICAELSYALVEKPSFRLRDYLAERRTRSISAPVQHELVESRVG